MRAIIHKSRASGSIIAPPSKSYAHRLLIVAALSNGISKIENVTKKRKPEFFKLSFNFILPSYGRHSVHHHYHQAYQ